MKIQNVIKFYQYFFYTFFRFPINASAFEYLNLKSWFAMAVDKSRGGIPYTAHQAQITLPPPLFLFFVFMLILG